MGFKFSPGCCCDDDTCCCTALVDIDMILVFIDEAQTVYHNNTDFSAQWDEDVALWDAAVAELSAPDYAQVVEVHETYPDISPNDVQWPPPSEDNTNIKPYDRDFPDGWTYDTIQRRPSVDQVKAVYHSAKGGEGVAHPNGIVLLAVDESGSMDRSTLGDARGQPHSGYIDFKDWLTSQNVSWKEVSFATEQWVVLAERNYREVRTSCVREYDFTVSGLTDTGSGNTAGSHSDDGSGIGDCAICDEIGGSVSVRGGIGKVTDFTNHGWDGTGLDWPKTDDVPSGATEACLWLHRHYSNVAAKICGGHNNVTQTAYLSHLAVYGWILARFKITSSSYKWRLILLFEMYDNRHEGTPTIVNSGWYWEHSSSDGNCQLTGGESWTLTAPSGSLTISNFCSGTLALTEKPKLDI